MSFFSKHISVLIVLLTMVFASSLFGRMQNSAFAKLVGGVSVSKKKQEQKKQTSVCTVLAEEDDLSPNEQDSVLSKDFIFFDRFDTLIFSVFFQVKTPVFSCMERVFHSNLPRYILFHNLKIATT